MSVEAVVSWQSAQTVECESFDELNEIIEEHEEKDGRYIIQNLVKEFGEACIIKIDGSERSDVIEDDELSILYWALEKLDAEVGLNEDEKPIFKRIAEAVDEPHGIEE